MISRQIQGKNGEDAAVDYVTKKGYHILCRNYRFERGEIDIIAEEGDDLVFIEVKARRSKAYGDPEDALTPSKCRQIKRVAEGFLDEHNLDDRSCRFDIIAVEYADTQPVVRHLQDAF